MTDELTMYTIKKEVLPHFKEYLEFFEMYCINEILQSEEAMAMHFKNPESTPLQSFQDLKAEFKKYEDSGTEMDFTYSPHLDKIVRYLAKWVHNEVAIKSLTDTLSKAFGGKVQVVAISADDLEDPEDSLLEVPEKKPLIQ